MFLFYEEEVKSYYKICSAVIVSLNAKNVSTNINEKRKASEKETIIILSFKLLCYSEFFKIKVFIGIYSKAVKSSHD